ncbi:serine/threonine-protein kinase, partial [Sphaerisporangium sp. NPDC005288]|uniref:serine/threonine-protein kinase n=1 Tax=Sphaerisporangium sp. NPDC005288 TaxID=3155114 RepID=UPI0033BA526A
MRGRGLEPGDPERVGRYLLSAVLGEGGQGTVYLGRAEEAGPVRAAGPEVAVKVLHTRAAGDAESRRRFVREVETARRVAAFCTARVLDVGTVNGRPFVVSEYIPGVSLAEAVARDGPRSGSGLQRLAVATLTALAAIHRAGVVHRDFKPANVILGPEGPVVIDFGIARALDHATTASGLIGTPAYIAPEQLAGHPPGTASDLFGWACTMVYAATGHLPFSAATVPALLVAVSTHEPDMSGVPDELRPALLACLAKDPAARPAAEQVLRALTGHDMDDTRPSGAGSALPGSPASPAPPTSPARSASPAGTRPLDGPRTTREAGLLDDVETTRPADGSQRPRPAGSPAATRAFTGPANLRARPQVTVTARSGWTWATIEG